MSTTKSLFSSIAKLHNNSSLIQELLSATQVFKSNLYESKITESEKIAQSSDMKFNTDIIPTTLFSSTNLSENSKTTIETTEINAIQSVASTILENQTIASIFTTANISVETASSPVSTLTMNYYVDSTKGNISDINDLIKQNLSDITNDNKEIQIIQIKINENSSHFNLPSNLPTMVLANNIVLEKEYKMEHDLKLLNKTDILNVRENFSTISAPFNEVNLSNKTNEIVQADYNENETDEIDLCKEPDVDAITRTEWGNAFVFKGDFIWHIRGLTKWRLFDYEGWPKKSNELFFGLPRNIDSAYLLGDYYYFTKVITLF